MHGQDGVTCLEFEFEWRFDAMSASKAIFKARTYSHILNTVESISS